jgi:hypothetical protein
MIVLLPSTACGGFRPTAVPSDYLKLQPRDVVAGIRPVFVCFALYMSNRGIATPEMVDATERRHATRIHDAYPLARMAEIQGSQADTITRSRRAGCQATVDYRRLHRGLPLAQDDGDGGGREIKVEVIDKR